MTDAAGADPYGAELDRRMGAGANGAVAATHGVSPTDATTALDAAPLSGVPASVGMRSPQEVAQQAEQQRQSNALEASPPLQRFVIAAAPAHVAATKDDFPALGNIAGMVAQAPVLNGLSFEDLAKGFGPVWQALQTDVQQGIAHKPAGMFDLSSYGNTLATLRDTLGLAGAPFSQYTEPFAHGLAALYNATGQYTPEQNLANARRSIGLAMFGLGPGEGGALGEAGGAGAAPELPPTGPAHPAPGGGFNATPEGFVADEAGAPVPFATQRDAAKFAAGNEPAPGTRFDVAQGEGDYFHAQQVPLVNPTADVPPPGVHPGVDGVRAIFAESDAADVARVQSAVADSATFQRTPTVMRDFLEQQMTGREAVVDPEQLVALAQAGHEPFPDRAAEILAAAQDGTEVRVPMSEYVTATAGQPFAEVLNATTTFREGGQPVKAEDVGTASAQVPPSTVAPPADFTPEETTRARTLAAEAQTQLQRVVQDQYLEGLFAKAKDIGMTKDQLARYSEGIHGMVQDASDRMTQRAYDQVLRERRPDWKASVAQHSATAEQELTQRPDIQARAALIHNRGPLGEPLDTPPLKIARDDPYAGYAEDNGLGKALSRNGMAADDIAPLFGYRSGADMIQDVAALEAARGDATIGQHMKAMARAIGEAHTRDELGFDLTPESIHDAASEMVNSPALTSFLSDELRALAERAGLPFDKAAVAKFAHDRFGAMTTKDALNIRALESYVYKGGVRAEKALLKGDFANAFRRKQQQFIHHLELANAHKFAKEWKSSQRQWKRAADNVSLPSVAQDAVNQVKSIIAATGRNVRANPADLANQPPLGEFIRAKMGMGAELIHAPVVPKPAAEMTVAQYRGMADMVKSILRNGRLEREVQLGDKRADLEAAVADGVASLNQYKKIITDAEIRHPNTLQKLDAARRAMDAWLVRQEQLLVRDFGAGDYNSPFFQAVTRPIQDRKGYANDQRVALAKHFNELNASVGKGFDKWMRARTPSVGPHMDIVDRNGDAIFHTNQDIVMGALHMGDEQALQKFADGYNTTPAAVEAAVHSLMDDRAWDVVQGIWRAFDRMRPDIEAMYKRLTDVTPTMVEPRPFNTPSGRTIPGGYFPISYDPATMPREWVEALDPQAMLGDMQYQRATPSNGYIKERTGVSAPVSLDFNSIHARLNQVIHDVAYREALINADKFLTHSDMTNAIARKYGPEYVRKLRTDLKHLAGAESTATNNNRGITHAINYLTEGQMINMIGYSPPTIRKHAISAFAQGARVVGPARFMTSAVEFFANPRAAMREASAESSELRHVYSAVGEDARREFLSLTEGTGLTKAVRMFAFQTIGIVNKTVGTIVYNAAKLKIAEEDPSLDEATVRAAAEHLVRQGIGSSGAADAPEALRSDSSVPGQVYRLSNQFLTFLNHMLNISREIPQGFGYGARHGQKPQIGQALGTLLAAVIIPAYAEFDRAKKVKSWLGQVAEAMLHQTLGPIPVLNSGVGAAAKMAGAKDYPSEDSTPVSVGEEIGQNIHDLTTLARTHHATNAMVRHGLVTGGQFGRFPGLEASRLEGFFVALAAGRENKPLTQVLDDFMHGPKEPK